MTDDLEKPMGRQAKWRKDNPEKYKAHLRVAHAIRTGRLVKQPCAICGNPRVDFHHSHGYRDPLRGQFLCRFHHVAAHRRGVKKADKK